MFLLSCRIGRMMNWLKERWSCFVDGLSVPAHDVPAQLQDWPHDELVERALELLAIAGLIGPLELLEGWVVEVFTPEALHEHTLFYLKLLSEETCKSVQSEGPAEVSRAEGHCAVGGVHLESFSSLAVLVGGDDHIGVLDDAVELL